ncbi:MAG TPA: NAD(P)/FAD-dependent oxidoreductase [Patescibacteria group bacterium]|nr:NAD(P)/FAD-dependent oxidoreductase [Patescibacteria group bacterium]
MTDTVDCAIIGAGVVGLAIARALAQSGHEVVVLEAAEAFGTGASARNSEVIHAGMYYPAGSLKARFCVRGNRLIRDFLAARGIAHRMTGKLIVANSPAEEETLVQIQAKGRANGVDDLQMISAAAARALEPALTCTAALLSPSTGILDSHATMLALLGDSEARGALLVLKSPVLGGEVTDRGILLSVGGAEPSRLLARHVINAAGQGAQAFASALRGLPPASVPPLHLVKGNYFLLDGRPPFSHLVYPTPPAIGLGVHFTLDLAGQGRFGPDTEPVETPSHTVDPARGDGFYAIIRRYWPDLPDGALRPGYAGIRTLAHALGDSSRDFIIQGPAEHGVAGLVNLYGIESPGLTSSLAIAEHVTELLR